ncbi:cytochrome P450 [Marmoricola sp. OAE513]|uniref:cytochrome P450 n=1 Tax=Marmoricola sp. OAE513 TaxID=2817894 RepID=UPI001AE4A1B6
MTSVPRAAAAWTLAHGIQRAGLKYAARKGQVTAQLAIDPVTMADPFAAYERLRGSTIDRGPVVNATVDHATANQILRSDDFGTGAGKAELPRPLQKLFDLVADPYTLSPVDPPSLLATDPPEHTAHRKLVSGAFTARKVMRLNERVEEVASELLDKIVAEGGSTFDLVDRYAARLPVAVIAELLGIPDDEHDQLLAWGNRAAVTLDPGLTFRQYRSAADALREMHHWFEAHVERLRRKPGEDLLSGLAQMTGDDAMSPLELRAVGLLVLGAGFETTVNLIGNAVVDLSAHPDQRAMALEEPDRWGNVVEEVLRWDSPVQLTMRAVVRDTEVGGEQLRAGEAVLVLLGGANRDPKVFENPARFDVTRANADQHLAFSAGAHFCLGASLARLEATTALRLLYNRFPDLEVAGTPVRRGTRVLRGYEHVPISTRASVAT